MCSHLSFSDLMTQALMLPADRAANMFESEQFITHFIPIVSSVWLAS